MRIKSKTPFKILTLLMASIMFSLPIFALAQQNLNAEAKRAAERDARNDVKPVLWFLGGCIGSFVVLIVAYSSEPTSPCHETSRQIAGICRCLH